MSHVPYYTIRFSKQILLVSDYYLNYEIGEDGAIWVTPFFNERVVIKILLP